MANSRMNAAACSPVMLSGSNTVEPECRTSEAVIRQRLDKRATRNGSVSDGRWEIYHAQLGEWEPPDDIPPDERIVLDRSKPIEALLTELTVIVPPEWDDHTAVVEKA